MSTSVRQMSTCGQAVLQDRRIACAITDRHLKVVEVGGAVTEVLMRESVLGEADDGRTPVRYIPCVRVAPGRFTGQRAEVGQQAERLGAGRAGFPASP